jgi:hypothetical protein
MSLILISLLQTKLKKDTKLKHILQDSNENKMLPLQKQLADNINHLRKVCESETAVFIAICQGYWNQMGKVKFIFFRISLPCLV